MYIIGCSGKKLTFLFIDEQFLLFGLISLTWPTTEVSSVKKEIP